MTKFILIIAISLMSQGVQAKTSTIQRVLFELGFMEDPSVQICPENTRIDLTASEEQLWRSAQRAQEGYDQCEAAIHLRSLLVSYPGGRYYKEAYRAYIQTFLDVQDFIMAMNEANQYIDDNKGYNDSEYIHLLLLRAVYGEIKQTWRDKERQMEFVSLSLGAALTQTEESPYLMNLQYRKFLDRYPNSIWKNEVLGMLNEARQMYGRNVLSEARFYLMKMDYPTAFQKYNVILKWGPVVEIFEEALYEVIQYHFQLSWILTNKSLLSDFKL
ncbi:MAG: outer membrane protein assembly factor BamD, partial [Bdellovibrio sp.]|nr:outer membrane protein assembly factor BamD [Bdellovibrio sp.]